MKVSQYFELPLYTKGGFLHQSDGSGKPLVQFATKEQADIAANCINRAGALAGALNDIAIVAASIPLDEAHHDLTYIYARAVEALAAYRGGLL